MTYFRILSKNNCSHVHTNKESFLPQRKQNDPSNSAIRLREFFKNILEFVIYETPHSLKNRKIKLEKKPLTPIQEIAKNKVQTHLENNHCEISQVSSRLALHVENCMNSSAVETELIRAICTGDLNSAQKLIRSGANVNFIEDKDGITPLVYAICKKNTKMVKLLLDNGAQTNFFTRKNFSPLLFAGNDLEIIKLLVEYGANINLSAQEYFTPLSVAIQKKYTDVIQFYIEKGLDLQALDKKNRPPLLQAIDQNYIEAINLFIQNGANVNYQDIHGDTPLLRAAAFGQYKTIEILLKAGADPSIINKNSNNLFTLVKGTRIPQWRKITYLAKKSLDNSSKAYVYSKKYLHTKLLAHAYHLKGMSKAEECNIDWEGGNGEISAAAIAKSINKFSEEFPSLLDEDASQLLTQSIEFSANHRIHTADHFYQRIKKGLPTFILTGFSSHSITVLIWKNHIIICNRGLENSGNLMIGRYDPLKLNQTSIQKLIDLSFSSQENYRKALNNGSESSLLKEVGFEFQTKNSMKLQKMTALSNQKVGNCTWANTEGAVKAYFLLSRLENDSFEIPKKHRKLEKDVSKTFNNWLFFHRLTALEKYIDKFGKDNRDDRLIQQSFFTLFKDCSKNPLIFDKSLLKRKEVLEKKYLSQISAKEEGFFRTKKVFHTFLGSYILVYRVLFERKKL